MLRSSSSEIPACPTLFTPLQMHLREILQLGLSGWVRWLRDNIVSLQHLVETHQVSMVVAMAHARYTNALTFEDTDTIEIKTIASIPKNGSLITSKTSFSGSGVEVAQVEITLRPVILTGDVSLSAVPGKLPPEIIAKFQEAEINSRSFQRRLQKLIRKIEGRGEGQLLAEGSHPFMLHRYAMDFADQWAFMEVAAYVSASRESLVLSEIEATPKLRHGISQGIQQFDLELHRPYFLFDRGWVETKIYSYENQLVFIHRLWGNSTGTQEVHATAIEQISIPEENSK